jgi:Lar family restriction alleviation protein
MNQKAVGVPPIGLMPCPFCGNAAPAVVTVPDQLELAFVGHCEKCDAFGPGDTDPGCAVELWNSRAPALS